MEDSVKKMEESDEKTIDIKKQFSGTIYQIKVLLFLLCRARKIKNINDFYLRTEVKDAEKFDDAVFYYRKNGEQKYGVRYCQIKNSESENAELTYSDFVGNYEKSVANIKKYFLSFRKIKMTSIDENIEDFVLGTTYRLPLELKKPNNENEILLFTEDYTPDELFDGIQNIWKKYKFLKISLELQYRLMKMTNLDLLAEELIEAIIKSKRDNSSHVQINIKNFWFSIYESALKAEKVIVKKKVKETTNKKNDYYVFDENFLNNMNISKQCENFRTIFLDRFGEKFMNLFLRDKHFSVDDSFKSCLYKKKKGSENDSSSCCFKKEADLEELAKQICASIFYDKPMTSEILTHNIFLRNVFKSVKNEKAAKFKGDFVKNENQTMEKFRKYFLTNYAIMVLKTLNLKLVKCENKNIRNSFKDNNKVEVRYKTLINNDGEIKTEIEEFFEKFSIQTLPRHDELMEVIQDEIREEFILLENTLAINYLLQKVEKWFKSKEEEKFDKIMFDTYFKEIKKDIVKQIQEKNADVPLKTIIDTANHLIIKSLPNNCISENEKMEELNSSYIARSIQKGKVILPVTFSDCLHVNTGINVKEVQKFLKENSFNEMGKSVANLLIFKTNFQPQFRAIDSVAKKFGNMLK